MKKYDFHIHTPYSDGISSMESMIQTAIDRNMEKIAITDHMNAFGHFLFSSHNPLRSIDQYLREITRLRQKYKNQIEIYTGAEISEDFLRLEKSYPLEDRLQGNLEYFSLFLIETIFISEPILTARNVRKYLNDQGFEHIPVILAHPNYSQMDFMTFQTLVENNIGLELNESKFSEMHAPYLMKYVDTLTHQQKSKLTLSLGSDAHGHEETGSIEFVSAFIEQHQLWNFVITPPRVQDFLLA